MSDSQKGNGKQSSGNGNGVWITGVMPDDPVSSVATRSMERRLAAVQHYLPLAAEKAEEDMENVHQLRVATTRSMAAMKLYDAVLPHRDAGTIKTDLKQVRRSAKEARDYDIFISRLCADKGSPAAECFAENLRACRRRAQEPIVAVYQELTRDDCFQRDVARMLDRLRAQQEDQSRRDALLFGQWSRSSLRPIVKKFFSSEPIDWASIPALHQLRIRGKSLRYAMELLGPAFPKEFHFELYPIVERVQKMLDMINDHAKSLSRFGDWFGQPRDASHRDYLTMLLADEHLRLEQSRDAFVTWWQPRRNDVHTWFEDLIASSVAGDGSVSDTATCLDILVAEDSLVNQTLAIGLLCNLNHRVTVAANGREAVGLTASHNFDLVLMDVEMPEMDGLVATRMIRRREGHTGRHVPVIAVTSETREGIREQCLAAGMDGYLPKPLRVDPLGEMLDSIFRRSAVSPARVQTPSPLQLCQR